MISFKIILQLLISLNYTNFIGLYIMNEQKFFEKIFINFQQFFLSFFSVWLQNCMLILC